MNERQREIIRSALSESEQATFDAALEAEGLQDEVALLRMHVRRALADTDADPKVLFAGMNALVRAVTAEFRISPKGSRELADRMTATLNMLGDLILPADR